MDFPTATADIQKKNIAVFSVFFVWSVIFSRLHAIYKTVNRNELE